MNSWVLIVFGFVIGWVIGYVSRKCMNNKGKK